VSSPGRRWTGRFFVAALAVSVTSFVGEGIAHAHAYLESTDPSQSSVNLTSPGQVVLHFDEPVEIDFGSIHVFGPDGRRVDEGGTHHPAGQSSSVAISLPSRMRAGTYVVAWHVISADSHPVHGAYIFSIGTDRGAQRAASLANTLSTGRGSTAVGVLFGAIRFVAYAGLLVLVGMGSLIVLTARSAVESVRVRRVLWASWVSLFVCSVLGIAVQGVYAASLPLTRLFDLSLSWQVLHTRFGEVELLRILLLLLVLPALLELRHRFSADRGMSAGIALGAVGGLGLLLTPGLSGHASTTGNPLVGTSLDLAHLGAASVWIGGLTLLGVLLLPGSNWAARNDVWEVARRFSPYAFGAVLVVVASGLLQSLRQVGSLYALFHTAYGRILIVKVILVIVLIAVGSVSRRLVTGAWIIRRAPMAESQKQAHVEDAALRFSGSVGNSQPDPESTRVMTLARRPETPTARSGEAGRAPVVSALRLSVLAELLIAAAVLVATSLLVNAPPARQAASQPFSQSFEVLGFQLNVIIDPARVGPKNQFHFYVLGRTGQPVGIPELDAAISLRSDDIGPISLPLALAGPGHYIDSNSDIPLAGTWTLKLTVRTSPIDEQEVFAAFSVH
jgi:copper transport protein